MASDVSVRSSLTWVARRYFSVGRTKSRPAYCITISNTEPMHVKQKTRMTRIGVPTPRYLGIIYTIDTPSHLIIIIFFCFTNLLNIDKQYNLDLEHLRNLQFYRRRSLSESSDNQHYAHRVQVPLKYCLRTVVITYVSVCVFV